jgi:hypothetical protein
MSSGVKRARIGLKFMAAGDATARRQVVQITANSQLLFYDAVEPWKIVEFDREIEFSSEIRDFFVRVRCTYIAAPKNQGGGEDPRRLGVYLSAFCCTCLNASDIADSERAFS